MSLAKGFVRDLIKRPHLTQAFNAYREKEQLMEIKQTNRGFTIAEFVDQAGIGCSLQKSSSAMEDCIWLGANEIGLKEFIAYRQPSA